MKFKVGDKVRVRKDLKIDGVYGIWCFNSNMSTFEGKELTVEKVYDESYRVKENTWYWTDEMLEEVKEDKMEKTFREVIADIKEGEVWEGGSPSRVRIRCSPQGIEIKGLDNWGYIGKNVIFKLQRKEYTFSEAYKAYKEGKEIENELYKYKIINGEHSYFYKRTEEWDKSLGYNLSFTIEEIDKLWYINE